MINIQIQNFELNQFALDLIQIADKHNIDVLLSKDPEVWLTEDFDCNGYFDIATRKLAVACGQPIEQWYPVLVHESCHLDQYIEKSPVWTNALIGGIEAVNILELWINHQIELNDEQLWKIIDAARDLELDCERRTIQKFKKYSMPINVEQYTKQANAYIYLYNIVAMTRSWFKTEPYYAERIWSQMPSDFNRNYKFLPISVMSLFINHLSLETPISNQNIDWNHPRFSC